MTDTKSSGRRLQVAVLLSGSGTSLENLFDHIDRGLVDADVSVVVSSKADAFGLERARRRGVPAVAVPRKQHPDLAEFNDVLHRELAQYDVDLVALLGFLSLFELRGTYEGRAINTHPALIPAFCGKGFYGHHVHEAVIASGVRVSGATVHIASDEYDKGPILLQEAVPVLSSDTADTLAARVQAMERRLVPRAIQLFAEDRVRFADDGARVVVSPG